jgi:hypothetical protein
MAELWSQPRPRGPAVPPMGQGLAVIASVILIAVAFLAAIGVYLLSLHVAAANDRGKALDAQILAKRQQVERLKNELDFRSRFVELQRWSGPLGLQPADSLQYAPAAVHLDPAARKVTLRTEQPVIPAKPCEGNACQGASTTANRGYTPNARQQMDSLVGGVLN